MNVIVKIGKLWRKLGKLDSLITVLYNQFSLEEKYKIWNMSKEANHFWLAEQMECK